MRLALVRTAFARAAAIATAAAVAAMAAAACASPTGGTGASSAAGPPAVAPDSSPAAARTATPQPGGNPTASPTAAVLGARLEATPVAPETPDIPTSEPDTTAASPTARPVFIATARPPAAASTPTPVLASPVPTITPIPGRPPARITAIDNRFQPDYVEVPVGTLVRWENRGANDHDVVADDLSFESPVFRPGQTYQYVFGQPGTFTYLCDLHDAMVGTIVVQ